jgi:hypothetical protein
MDLAHALPLVASGVLTVCVARLALRHAAAGHRLLSGGTDRPRVITGMVRALTFTSLFGVGAVTGGFLLLLLQTLARQ